MESGGGVAAAIGVGPCPGEEGEVEGRGSGQGFARKVEGV